MVQAKIFGVQRNLDIPADVFLTDDEIAKKEECLPGCEHGWFDSVADDGAKLHYRKWVPKGQKPSAILIFMHGIATHSGKGFVMKDGRKLGMSLITDRCLKEGYAFYSFDMYGHGFSEGTRYLIPGSWEKNLDDYRHFVNLVASQNDESIPIILVGESYGCTLTIHLAKHFQEHPESGPKNFDSVILTGPAIIGDLPPYPVYCLLRYGLAPLFPSWRPFFMPNTVSADRIWRDPEVLALTSDPRYHVLDGSGIPFRLGTALNLVLALEEVRNKAIPGFKIPYCILHGTNDYGVPITGSEFMWSKTATSDEDREFHRIEGAYHDIFADARAEECMQHVVDWVQKRQAKSSK